MTGEPLDRGEVELEGLATVVEIAEDPPLAPPDRIAAVLPPVLQFDLGHVADLTPYQPCGK